MKLISCLSPMLDNDEMDHKEISDSENYFYRSTIRASARSSLHNECKNQKITPNKHHHGTPNLCCPKCSSVIDEFRQTRMSILRKRCDHDENELDQNRTEDINETVVDANEEIINIHNERIRKFKENFIKSLETRLEDSKVNNGITPKSSYRSHNEIIKNVEMTQDVESTVKFLETQENNGVSSESSYILHNERIKNVEIEQDGDEYNNKSTEIDDNNDTSPESSLETLSDNEFDKYSKILERSFESLEDEILNNVQIRLEHKFNALDIATGIPETLENSNNRLSTKSSSDSQLERNSRDFRTNFSNFQNYSVDGTNILEKPQEETISTKAFGAIKEIIDTERNYVETLSCIVEEYIPELQRKDIVQGLRGQKFLLFGNVEKIYDFHRNIFLKDLEKCLSDWRLIGKCFLEHERMFNLYVLYNRNKPKSDAIMADYGYFFEDKRRKLNLPLDLSSYLLAPVQRLSRYMLLLDKLLKEIDNENDVCDDILKAKEMIVYTLRHGDDLLYMDGIKHCDINLEEQGKLLRQEQFEVSEDGKKWQEYRIFLFQDLILFSIPCKLNKQEYNYHHSWKMTDVGRTDDKGTKFKIWFRKYQNNKFTLKAANEKIKKDWFNEIDNILLQQAMQYKLTKERELAALGICRTQIPIQAEESDEDEKTSNKKYYSTRSLRGVPGEIQPRKVLDRTTWYCTVRTEEEDTS